VGIGFVLLLWAILGLASASVGAIVFGGGAAFLTRGAETGRPRLIAAASFFPFLCLAWAGAVFVFQATVNEMVLHRDPGLGDTWECPLPDGYALLMIDTTDEGWVYNPKTQPWGGVGEQGDTVANVRTIQISGRYILGGSNVRSFEDFGDGPERVDSYFLLDTQAGKHANHVSYEALRRKRRI
jgi:hypothetical protein